MSAPSIVIEETRTAINAGEHVIADLGVGGPTLLVFGSLHGNESAGARALLRVRSRLDEMKDVLAGRVVFLAGNTRALAVGVRFIDTDLNRHWTKANITKNRDGSGEIQFSEDLEQRELLPLINDALARTGGEVYALDLHSTSAGGSPFATVGDTLRNRAFATKFPVTILLGIEEQLEGTLLEYLNNRGVVTFGFEAGQHFAESTVQNHEALVWLALIHSGILAEKYVPDLDKWYGILSNASGRSRIVEVRYRHAITPEDEFAMDAGYENFQPIGKGQKLARDRHGDVRSPEKGMILMPLYQKLGEDGFFVGREVARFWIWLSGILRRSRFASLMPLLPGVSISAADPETLEIDTRIARFFPLQIFHLLGFRRRRWQGKQLVVSRRKFDTVSPFQPDLPRNPTQ